MGLRDDIQEALGEAFTDPDGLADVVVSFTLRRYGTVGAYDPVTGERPRATTLYPTRGTFNDLGLEEIDRVALAETGDEWLTVLGNEVGTTPTVDDEVQMSDGSVLPVKNVTTVPGGGAPAIIYKLLVRRRG